MYELQGISTSFKFVQIPFAGFTYPNAKCVNTLIQRVYNIIILIKQKSTPKNALRTPRLYPHWQQQSWQHANTGTFGHRFGPTLEGHAAVYAGSEKNLTADKVYSRAFILFSIYIYIYF